MGKGRGIRGEPSRYVFYLFFFVFFSNAQCLVASEQTLTCLPFHDNINYYSYYYEMGYLHQCHEHLSVLPLLSISLDYFITANTRELLPSHNA